ncbi:MAG: hypothetical protein NVSMB59_09820 [Vulcanimicrobiaceae bacterium]
MTTAAVARVRPHVGPAHAAACVATVVAILATLARGGVGADCVATLARGARILASRTVPTTFGPETAAFGSDGGALGWLAACANAALSATPLGSGACSAAAAACALGGFACVAWRACRIASPAFAFAAVALAYASSLDALHAGGATTTLLASAALVVALDIATPLGIAIVFIVAALWCNADASGIIAPAFAIARALGCAIDDRAAPRTRYAVGCAFAASLALLVTPEGLAFPRLALASLRLAGDLGDAVAWAPADVAPHAYRAGYVALIACALAVGLRARGWREALPALVALVASLANGALLPLGAVVAAPLVAAAATARWRTPIAADASDADRRTVVRHAGARRAALTAAGTALAIVVTSLAFGVAVGDGRTKFDVTSPSAREADAALRALGRERDVRGVACTEVTWCDVAVGRGFRVLADSRIGAMPANVRAAQTALVRAKRRWRDDANALRIDAVVVRENATLATLLAADGWRPLAPGARVVAYVRPLRP